MGLEHQPGVEEPLPAVQNLGPSLPFTFADLLSLAKTLLLVVTF